MSTSYPTRQDYPPSELDPPIQRLSKIVKLEKISKQEKMKELTPKPPVKEIEVEIYQKLLHHYTKILDAANACGLNEDSLTLDSLIITNYTELLAVRAIRLKRHNEKLKRDSQVTKSFKKIFS